MNEDEVNSILKSVLQFKTSVKTDGLYNSGGSTDAQVSRSVLGSTKVQEATPNIQGDQKSSLKVS